MSLSAALPRSLCSAASGYAGLAPKEIAFPATFVSYILSGLLISIFLENETTGIDSHEKPALIIAWPLFLVLWGVAFALYGLALLFVAALKRLFPVIPFANIGKLVNVRCWQLLHWVLAASIILLLINILGGDRHFFVESLQSSKRLLPTAAPRRHRHRCLPRLQRRKKQSTPVVRTCVRGTGADIPTSGTDKL